MLYIVAYDIPNDRRRTRLHKALCGFGEWTQFSLFECFLDATELVRLRARLESILDPNEDSVRIYPLCSICKGAVETIGGKPPEQKVTYVV
ncbi:MAG: CRISPR-associated endonuclease Cas2 [Anaerolineae bacterium]|nr:CRISPR-associated endonuclease Cas2 [Anaerolineae bacterium]